MKYLLGLVLLVKSGVAFAAPDIAHAETEHTSAGLPQMDPTTFSSQIFWMFVFFAVLYVLMSRFALPRVGHIVTGRKNKIMSDLNAADEIRTQTEEVRSYHEQAVHKSHEDAHTLMIKLQTEILEKHTAAHEKLDNDIALQEMRSEKAITEAKEKAMAGIEKAATSIAVEIAHKIGGIAVNDNDVAEAVKALAKTK